MAILRQGSFARRPNGPLPAGFTYYATDQDTVYVWNGGAWLPGLHDPRQAHWETTLDWSKFTNHPITNIIGTTALDVEPGGIGTITSADEHGSDRQVWVLNGFTGSDMETHIEYAINSANAQLGLAMRVSEIAPGFMGAVTPWNNVLFGANANILPGIWEWNGTNSLDTNQQSGSLGSIEQEIVSAEGDGTTVTVQTVRPHMLSAIQGTFGVKMNFGPYSDNGFVVTATGATTFTFADTETFGPVTTGTWDLDGQNLADDTHRGFAARVISNEVTFKHWFVDYEPEPSWANPLRVFTYEIPAALDSGRSLPGTGGAGFLVGHLGNTGRTVKVNDFQVKALD